MLDWIIRYWVQWLFGLICAALLAGYRRLAKRVKVQEAERKAIKNGLRNMDYLYRSYHALGGNGTGTELYNRAKALPIKND